ncbi:MAG: Hsp70 family protein, partial [Gammaproteobacteria bacterium]|nr:Hsp70 family protein [Gammaproteobacteria bacterium]
MSESRYAIGIDLGTTHCVLAHVPLEGDAPPVDVISIPQTTRPGEVEARHQLPSFLYLPHETELAPGDLALPWAAQPPALVGTLARQLGAKTPLLLVASAKSWLCHGGVDRRADFLPLNAPDDLARASPLTATRTYLEHLVATWNHTHPDAPLAEQEVIVTIPASFDPGARELTAEAARQAGIERLTLLEEPQAAVYAWIESNGEDWREHLGVGDVLLVVDLGGGTCDFSLVAVHETDGSLSLERVAVGEHILLGGD